MLITWFDLIPPLIFIIIIGIVFVIVKKNFFYPFLILKECISKLNKKIYNIFYSKIQKSHRNKKR